jgi:hypothetical protein
MILTSSADVLGSFNNNTVSYLSVEYVRTVHTVLIDKSGVVFTKIMEYFYD